jgi:LysM repeat protein
MQHKRRFLILFTLVMMIVSSFGMAGVTHAQALNGGCGQIHTVQRGENLFRIALRYGTTVAKIQADNAIYNANLIYVGQQLCIIKGTTNPQPAPPLPNTYVVRYGDTLRGIARTFGVDMFVLARVNNIVNVNRIYAGQLLTIPDFTIQ